MFIISTTQYSDRGPGNSVGIAIDYGLDGLGIESWWGENFRLSGPALGPTQPPVQWISGLSWGKVQLRHAADHSPPSSATAMEEYSYTSTHPLGHNKACNGEHFTFTVTHILIILNLLKIISKFCPAVMTVTTKHRKVSPRIHKCTEDKYIYLKFLMTASNDSIIITTKQKL